MALVFELPITLITGSKKQGKEIEENKDFFLIAFGSALGYLVALLGVFSRLASGFRG